MSSFKISTLPKSKFSAPVTPSKQEPTPTRSDTHTASAPTPNRFEKSVTPAALLDKEEFLRKAFDDLFNYANTFTNKYTSPENDDPTVVAMNKIANELLDRIEIKEDAQQLAAENEQLHHKLNALNLCKEIETDQHWDSNSGDLIPFFLSRFKEVNVSIYNTTNPENVTQINCTHAGQCEDTETIKLLLHKEHYYLVKNPNGEPVPENIVSLFNNPNKQFKKFFVPVSPDGNCLFSCFLAYDSIKQGNQGDIPEDGAPLLRKALANDIRENYDKYKDLMLFTQ